MRASRGQGRLDIRDDRRVQHRTFLVPWRQTKPCARIKRSVRRKIVNSCAPPRPRTSPAKEPAGGGFICSANNFLRLDFSAICQPHPAHALLTENKRFNSCFEMNRLPRQTRDQLLRHTPHPARRKQRTTSDKALQVVEKQTRARLQAGIKQHAAEKRTREPHEKIFPESAALQKSLGRKITRTAASGHGHDHQTHHAQLIRER